MFIVYPSNRLEDLMILLDKVLETRQGSIFEADQILVESQGMQHWINMQLAKTQGIAMNIEFPMPSRFIWNLARAILGEMIPEQSPYSREILSFRIEKILSDNRFIEQTFAKPLNQYWQTANQSQQYRRFQLATKLADVFEQYMLYRPEWLELWQQNQMPAALQTESLTATAQWQQKIWQLLVAEQPYHQANLQDLAIAKLDQHLDKLPEQIYIFGINALPPKSLAFFEAISEHIPVHLFHLNPSVEFWGDLQTDKHLARAQRAKKVADWTAQDNIRNPLLANLGGQGKAFFNSLQQLNTYEISGYSDLEIDYKNAEKPSVLVRLQQDILNLTDAAEQFDPTQQAAEIDDSIVISSSHSALREIQTLHDYLLHQFNCDPNLKPQDIVVMCPAIEDYAPYIQAVFKRPGITLDEHSIRLPCSIADRKSMDAEPLVNSFIELLNLPDSRFEISKILDYLRLPALQNKFGFSEHELTTIENWLLQAQIHWGLDAGHKAVVSELTSSTPTYSWQWGLERLLYGFAWGNELHIANNQLWLPHVEGQDTVLLGRLCHLLERLQFHSKSLLTPRLPSQWHAYLHELKNTFFAEDDKEQDAFFIIDAAINALTERCGSKKANFDQTLDLTTLRYFLTREFSQPDQKNHFLTGQITFCSMVPMRSIPFKIIAVLGLNDGQYPRQQNPISFDLMAATPTQAGDRSRRGDDRYLFLEALISARNHLYLSYQGRDIRNNEPRQPSLILKELMDYLSSGYGWQFDIESAHSQLLVNPLHPFSEKAYQGKYPSFDPNWWRLIKPEQTEKVSLAEANLAEIKQDEQLPAQLTIELKVEQLVDFFTNPLACFAKQTLHLYLNDFSIELDDVEPFSLNSLDEYLFRQGLTKQILTGADKADFIRQFQLSGQLPETPMQDEVIETLAQPADLIAEQLSKYTIKPTHANTELLLYFTKNGDWIGTDNELLKTNAENQIQVKVKLSAQLEQAQELMINWRAASRKGKDELRLWLNYLTAMRDPTLNITSGLGVYLDAKKEKLALVNLTQAQGNLTQAKDNLTQTEPKQAPAQLIELVKIYLQTMHFGKIGQPVYFIELAKALLKKQEASPVNELINTPAQIKIWQKFQTDMLENDAYFKWFYPAGLDYQTELHQNLLSLFQPLYQSLTEVKS
ncbi:exodeoxyribonuclease V subunit gamma [Catenovulum sp. 2E275]|uniref:exodeoxyribonuclease V subunit gamma n=1 Tax=Catenovulum sp. 2E275 TaxID=2980497 RepID=UPI0021D26550|nr:exodeoxyribonuclease V subunit gamma [Catenovulum sp. 2E275]MCU4674600.1 exodeoxyribonuclease V subunit gamma [Catenovulum sp. 2E275]